MSLLRATHESRCACACGQIVSLNSLCNWKGPQSCNVTMLPKINEKTIRFIWCFSASILFSYWCFTRHFGWSLGWFWLCDQACRIDVHEIPKLMCSSELLESCRTGGAQKVKSWRLQVVRSCFEVENPHVSILFSINYPDITTDQNVAACSCL